ncbi:MAG: DNA glycosylase [Elusimicrobiota bacterium]
MKGSLRTTHFDLKQTLECGQFFNWLRLGDGYAVRTHGREFEVRQDGELLVFSGVEKSFIQRFFSLDHDPAAIRDSIPGDPWLDQAFQSYGRLRLLRQDPWECLVAFLLTPVSNIPRIQRNLLSVYERTGFEPERMRPAVLKGLGLGFRWRFLDSAARRVAKPGLEAWRRSGPEGMEGILGAGPKVRDCVRLFGYGEYSSFPVDTWIRKVLRRLYGVRVKEAGLRDWASRRFGPWAGYAQQWLFAWSRTHPHARFKGIRSGRIPART